jgi:secondary thiamine-phosphate synthase enzyme
MMRTLAVVTHAREEMLDVTAAVQEVVSASGHKSGLVVCFVPHTTAAITINEGADPDVCRDILFKLGQEIPRDVSYHHREGNSDAHIKASLIGSSQQILFEDGRLLAGTWQAVFFCEFDGPRRRNLIVKVIPFA